MRMAEDELVGQFVTHVGDVKLSFLVTNPRIEADMQQHISQLLADIRLVVLHEGVGEFECLFNRIGPQTLVGLFLVPWAILP